MADKKTIRRRQGGQGLDSSASFTNGEGIGCAQNSQHRAVLGLRKEVMPLLLQLHSICLLYANLKNLCELVAL